MQFSKTSPDEDAILRAIAISFLPQHASQLIGTAAGSDPARHQRERQAAFALVEEFKTAYAGRIPLAISWLTTTTTGIGASSRILYGGAWDVTAPAKLLACEVLHLFLQKQYAAMASESDRVQLRNAVLQACRVAAVASMFADNSSNASGSNGRNNNVGGGSATPPSPSDLHSELRILSKKLSALLEGLVIREFPQRWTTFADDVFAPLLLSAGDGGSSSSSNPVRPAGGGLWYTADPVDPNAVTKPATSIHLGVNICLEMLRLVAEDCTDSDFNAKISTTRRNDVLIGLNEVRQQFLPKFFHLLSATVPALEQTKASLHEMHRYLSAQTRAVSTLTADERAQYQAQLVQRQNLSLLLNDFFCMLERFASSFPIVWMLGSSASSASPPANAAIADHDFVAPILYMFREREGSVQLRAVECVEILASRGKLEFSQWMRLVREIPAAIQAANQHFAVLYEQRKLERLVNGGVDDEHPLALQLEFHRALSRMMASVISSHLLHLNNSSKQLSNRDGPVFQSIRTFMSLMVEILRHPSGRMCTEQAATWTSLFRDPQVFKTGILDSLVEPVMACYMDQLVRVRWEDVENQTDPNYQVLEASFDDEDDYETWMSELRSRSSNLFKYIGNVSPAVASRVLQSRVESLLGSHGAGQPFDFLDPSNRQLTQNSEAILRFEALLQPIDNTLSGLPSWVLSPDPSKFASPERNRTATATRDSLSKMANELVAWNPTYVWLKFRRASLLDPLKYVWGYDTSTLLQAVDSLLRYLGLPDEWQPHPSLPAGESMSGEIVSLKKKSGVTLVSISKKIPHHLVPWLSQLSEATRSLLSSDGLIPMNQMHLYEFLTCVASAVDDPQMRSNFISSVLADAMETIESVDVRQMVQSSHALLSTLGVADAQMQSVVDPANVSAVTARYVRIFTAYNRLLSVGRRCNEASKKRVMDGQTFQSNKSQLDPSAAPHLNLTDEGPVSIHELAVSDPFVPLWPRILPHLLTLSESILTVWRPEHQAVMLANPLQRYVYAISDDEAFLAKNQDGKSGGVFGEGGTAGSVVSGTDRRQTNLVPKFSGWFTELRNVCFQLLALLSAQRVMFAPEVIDLYPRIAAVITDPHNLRAMEHRHLNQFLTHVIELLVVCCPSTMYATHLAPILGPVVEHLRYRLEKTWLPVVQSGSTSSATEGTKALSSQDCAQAARLAAQGGDAWYSWYYAHAGLFVGDVDEVIGEAAVEKYRVDLGRTYSDVLLTAFALKGEWALVLANQAKEELAVKKNDPHVRTDGPASRFNDEGVVLNADGTPKTSAQLSSDARSLRRINGLCHFLLLENEQIASNLTITVIQSLGYPDAHTCRRITKICHRILETVAWSPLYSQVIGKDMFTVAVKNLVTEPKWMVGMEWEMINGTAIIEIF
jgi:Exportin-5 family